MNRVVHGGRRRLEHRGVVRPERFSWEPPQSTAPRPVTNGFSRAPHAERRSQVVDRHEWFKVSTNRPPLSSGRPDLLVRDSFQYSRHFYRARRRAPSRPPRRRHAKRSKAKANLVRSSRRSSICIRGFPGRCGANHGCALVDTQRRALAVGDDDFNVFHAGHHRKDTGLQPGRSSGGPVASTGDDFSAAAPSNQHDQHHMPHVGLARRVRRGARPEP
jgi:hypothetical protein